MYLSYDGRAFDKSLWNLQTAEVIERNGLPVTSETSPLSLSGFGYVSEKFPTRLTCRHMEQTMSSHEEQAQTPLDSAESIEHGRRALQLSPGACLQCYAIDRNFRSAQSK